MSKTTKGECCLMCGREWPKTKRRVCGKCEKPILKGHKFCFEGSTVRHRNCDKPTESHGTA